MSETVRIQRIGHAGDGVAEDGLFVPFTVPGDVVRVTRSGTHGLLDEIVSPGPSRVAALCRHFGRCGGCAVQHIGRDAYLAFKRELVVAALAQRGFADVPVEAIRAVGPGTRRRAMFKARATKAGIVIGFYARDSRTLIPLDECPVLVPALTALMQRLKTGLQAVLRDGETAELHATATHNGIDLSLDLKRRRDADILMGFAELASNCDLARLTWNGELVALAREPLLRIGRFDVMMPPGAFLQPTVEGERILQEMVRDAAAGAKTVADLFSGLGTFALVLAESHVVHAADDTPAQIDALLQAAKRGKARLTAETRDLFRRPFLPLELARFDAVVIDPPRPGAKAQAEALAQSAVPRVLYVSCNAASFARDARILCDGGYTLQRVTPVDQFVWSPHVEMFGLFTRG